MSPRPSIGGSNAPVTTKLTPGGSVPNWPRHRLALSVLGNRYVAFCLGIGVRDATAGYRAYRASTLETIGFDSTSSTGYAFQIEMTYRVVNSGGTIEEVPIAFTDREHGHSKMSRSIVLEAIWQVPLLRLRSLRRRL